MENSLGDVPLFHGLPEQQIHGLQNIAFRYVFKRGQVIFSDGDEANGFYVVRSGKVKIFKLSFEGKEQILHIIGVGEPFGEAPVFSDETYPAHAEALEEGEMLFFPKKAFIGLVMEDPSIALNMLAILSQRLRQFTQLVESLSLKGVPQRLASYLLFISESTNNVDSIELDVAKGQLASILGTIPETISRILGKMVNQGLIRVQGRTIRLVDKKGIEEIARGERTLI